MTKLRWSQFLLYKTTKNYAAAYRDDSLQHDDYVKGIHISAPVSCGVTMDSEFEFGGRKMKAIHVQSCHHWKDHHYIFCREIK